MEEKKGVERESVESIVEMKESVQSEIRSGNA